MAKTDQHFDGIADKFARNIYGTSKGQVRHTLLTEAMLPWLPAAGSRAIDIGGGTGIMSRYLADNGLAVTLTDASGEILSHAQSLLADCPQVNIKQARLQDLDTLEEYQFVVCHAVLEWLAEPFAAISQLYNQMASQARLSLSFFNRDAALFGNILYGNFDYIARGMKVKNQVRLNPDQPLRPRDVLAHCEQSGFRLLAKTGIRCFHDYMKEKPVNADVVEQILALERQYNQAEPFLWLGKYFHMILEKP